MSFFDKLYTIEDPTGVVSDKILAYINENFRIIEMTLAGKISSANIINNGISDDKISSADDWNDALDDISDIMSDLKLTSIEANQLSITVQQILSESTDIITVATTLGITTEKTNYETAIQDMIDGLDWFIDISA